MSKLNWITSTFCAGLLLASAAFADETKEERLTPGTRPVAHTEWLQMQQARANEDETTKESDVLELNAKLEEVKVTSTDLPEGSVDYGYQANTYYTTHNGAYHYPVAVGSFGSIVELEDGSIWNVADGDHYKTLNWFTNDLIVITPNHDWFSPYLFRMSNQNTGVSVKCNMTLGPIYYGYYTHWIVGINYYTQEIYLEDGSIWQVSGFDASIFDKWLLNDTVIIGVNDGFLSATKPNILINVNTLTYVRSTCIW